MNDKIDNQYPRIYFNGNIHLINNDSELESIEPHFSNIKIVGFDTETKPSFRKGENYKMALLQLSTETDAYLVRLHFINNFAPIKKLLEDITVKKIGLAIRDDIKGLQKLFHFSPQNFIELQDVAKKIGLKNFGLKGMSEEVLNATISKKAKLTNWETKTLSEDQKIYAATDAWICVQIYNAIDFLK